MTQTTWLSRRVRASRRAGFRLALEILEDRLTPDVTVPAGFANVSIVNTGLQSPAALETLPDGRVLVALQSGTVRVVQNDALLPQPLVTLSNVDSAGERGLLGITMDPNFAANRYIYVYYTANAQADPGRPFSHNRLSRLTVTGNTAGDERVLWSLPSIGNAIWHMGGAIHFGPDGRLYVSVGDHQQPPTAQTLTSQFGKILRLDVSTVPATIPADNPFYNQATGDNRTIWATGLRNPFTSAFQPGTGRFFLNDVGEGSWEEINPGAAGRNFGWPTTEGPFNPVQYPNFTNPSFAYPHSGPGTSAGCAISGGAFYNPQTVVFPAPYVGKYFFQDFCRGWIRTLDPVTNQPADFATGLSFPTDMRVSQEGALYYITRGQATGGLPATGGIGKIIYPANQRPLFTSHPADVTVAVGEPATFTATVNSPTPVMYQWQRDSANILGATSATYRINTTVVGDHGARFRLVATNTAGNTTSNEGVLTVINSRRPTGTITAPTADSTYRGGDTINFAGSGTDPEDGDLTASAFTWQVDFHHDDHVHPHVAPIQGITSGSFVVPTATHPEGTLFFRIYLTVRDSAGLTHTSFRDVTPQRSRVTINASHAGLRVNVNGQPQALPHTVNAVVNTDLPLEAPQVQAVGDITYQFVNWSNGGNASQVFRVPAADATLTATYRTTTIAYISDLVPSLPPTNGWGPIERDMSNGEQGARDGRPITLNGTVYAKGLGVHARSEVTYALGGNYSWFLSDVGMDDEVGANGTVVFEVWADGQKLYDSGVMNGTTATRSALVNVAGRNQLRLIVADAGDGVGSDHADWAGARLVRDAARPLFTVTGFVSPGRAATPRTFTVTARDGAGNPLTGYRGTVRFTSTDPSAQLPSDYTFTAGDNGTRNFTATLNSLGTHSIDVTDTASGMSGGQANIQVLAPLTLTTVRRSTAVLSVGGTLTLSGGFAGTLAGQTHRVVVRWGDGTADSTLDLAAGTATFIANHPYTQNGNYEIHVTLTASDGATDAVVLPAPVAAAAPPAGLTGWWTGDGANVVASPDLAGINAGALNGTVTYAAGRVGNAFGFPGLGSSFVNIPNAAALNSTTATWSFWIRSTQTGDYIGLVGKHDAAVSYNGVTIQMHQGLPRVEIKANPATTLMTGTRRLNDGQWHHVALSFQSGGASVLYVDGIQQSTATAPTFTFGATPLRFGKLLDAFWAPLNGQLDEVQIVNRVLTPAEIQAAVNAGAAGQIKGVRVQDPARLTRFMVTAYPSPVPAGQIGQFQVRALDQYGEVFPAYRGTVRFTSSDTQALLPSNYAFTAADGGARTFTAALLTAGTQSLTVIDTANGTVTGTQTGIVITPLEASALAVTGFPSPSTAGQERSFTVTARDRFGNVAPSYRGTVQFTSSDKQAALPDDYTFLAADNGSRVFSATLFTAGMQSLTAADAALTGTQANVLLTASVASVFELTGFPSNAVAGVAGTFTVTARDKYGNVATSYTSTVRFTSTDERAILPPATPLSSGIGTFRAEFRTAGLQTLMARDTEDDLLTQTFDTQVAANVVTQLLVYEFPSTPDAGSKHTFTVAAGDAFGNLNPDYRGTVRFRSSDPQALLRPDYTFTKEDQGLRQFTATLFTAGPQWLRAEDGDDKAIFGEQADIVVRPLAASMLYVAAPDRVQPGVPFTFVVLALDQYGNLANDPERLYLGTIRLTSTDEQAFLPFDTTFQPEDMGARTFAAVLQTEGEQFLVATDLDDDTLGSAAPILVGGTGPGTPRGGDPWQMLPLDWLEENSKKHRDTLFIRETW